MNLAILVWKYEAEDRAFLKRSSFIFSHSSSDMNELVLHITWLNTFGKHDLTYI